MDSFKRRSCSCGVILAFIFSSASLIEASTASACIASFAFLTSKSILVFACSMILTFSFSPSSISLV
jgi:hypothetical protein